MWLKWAQQPFRRPNWEDYEETFMKRWWEIEESFCSFNSNWEKLWKSLRCHFILPTFFFSVVFHFFPSFFLFFSVVYIFFFHLFSVFCFAPSCISSFYLSSLFFFCCLSVLLLSLFDKRCSPKRTVTLDEAVVEMEDEEEEKKTENERAGVFVRNTAKCCWMATPDCPRNS